MDKRFIDAQALLDISFKLGVYIFEQGYLPNFIVGVWRGGAPIGICVQEVFEYLGVKTDHIAIRTSSYCAPGERMSTISVHGLRYIEKKIHYDDRLLIVDDVYDTGLSVQQVIHDLQRTCRRNMPMVKVATPYLKLNNNKTGKRPDFYLEQTEDWLVFPHELQGLTAAEIQAHKPEYAALTQLAHGNTTSSSKN